MEKIVKEMIKDKKTCYFVSPHLDDAAFSAGGLISYLAARTKVVVITAFTRAGRDKHSLSALSYVGQCGYKSAEISRFFSARRKEDKELFNNLGVEVVHLGFFDALWRKKKKLNPIEKFSTLFINEFRYIYPTHRLHISKGKIYKEDEENLRKLENKLKEIIGEGDNSVVFCPLGLGSHVDHIMAREACTNSFPKVIYWEDSPYNLYRELEKDFIKKNNLKRKFFRKNQSNRKAMYPAYKTQFGKLFNGEEFNLPPEVYYTKGKSENYSGNSSETVSLSITKMFFASAIAPVLSSIVRKPKVVFPKKIGKYMYKKRFYPNTFNKYAFAVYENPFGKRAIAKAWKGAVKDLAYHTLKNELKILKILNCVLERVNDSIPHKYSNIHIPTLLEDVETKGGLIILKEFVKGDCAALLNRAEKFNIYLKSNNFLRYLGENLTEKEKKNISKRSALGIVILYPFLLMKAIFTNPRASWSLIVAIPSFFKSVPIFLKHTSLFFGDRDLNPNNILVSGKDIYLIDFQFCMFSEPLYDAIYRLCAHWDEEDFCLLLFEHLRSYSLKHREKTETLIRGLMVHVATHALTVNDLSKETTNRNFAFLNSAKKGSFEFAYSGETSRTYE